MTSRRPVDPHDLDAFLDRRPGEDELREFLQDHQGDPVIESSIRLQEKIDGALRALYKPATDKQMRAWSRAALTQSTKAKPLFHRYPAAARLALAAACIAITAIALHQIWQFVNPAVPVSIYGPRPWKSMVQVYQEEASRGFTPSIVCRDDDQFSAFVSKRFGHPLLLATLPAGIEASGWSYSHTLSPRTAQVLCRVNDTNVLVFMDRAAIDNDKPTAPCGGLNVFRRVLEPMVLYEVTPLPEAHLLEKFYDPSTSP
jgi:hypothetical protein